MRFSAITPLISAINSDIGAAVLHSTSPKASSSSWIVLIEKENPFDARQMDNLFSYDATSLSDAIKELILYDI